MKKPKQPKPHESRTWTFVPKIREGICEHCINGVGHFDNCLRPTSCSCPCNSIELRRDHRDAIRRAATQVSSEGIRVLKRNAMAAAAGR